MDPIRIAIIGGGLGGACLANGLAAITHLNVQVFEAKPAFSERGASVGLHEAAVYALDEIFPSRKDMLNKAGAVVTNATMLRVGSGPHAGELVFELGASLSSSSVIVQRASLLRELLAPLPKDILHPSKKTTGITSTANGDKIQVAFDDGTSDEFDAVIGADGIFSVTRSYVHGDSAADHVATPAGFWDSRSMIPFEMAKKVLGDEYFTVDMQHSWAGDGGFLMHDVAENRSIVQCVMCMVEKDDDMPNDKNRKRPLTREFLESSFHTWLDGPIAHKMIDLTLDQPKANAYSQWEHKTTPTYAKGRVCIMGDAAHATTPFMGSGAAMAFEDAAVLSTLLLKVTSHDDIAHAFRAFDTQRRPRCQRIITDSRETGLIVCGRGEPGLNPKELAETMGPRWDFIVGFDIKAHLRETLDLFDRYKSEANVNGGA